MDLVLLSLACFSREEGLLSVCLTVISGEGDGTVEQLEILMIITVNKFHDSGFPGGRERSYCELVYLLKLFQIPIGHKCIGSQTTLVPLFVELLALFCVGFKNQIMVAFAKLLLSC